MQQIEIDFDVWKELTSRRRNESHSYNSVIRELLNLPDRGASTSVERSPTSTNGKVIGNRFLPDGTKLRAKHKGRMHVAETRDSELYDETGQTHNSASAAARAVTGTTVNGLLFWEVKRPGDSEWRK
jgi:hypothetical protein